MSVLDIKNKLLELTTDEKKERLKVIADYCFYRGKSIDIEAAQTNPLILGQNWINNSNLDYVPTQDIRNKVKPLLKKQARFMFGVKPTLVIKPNNLNEMDRCEELRMFLDDFLESNKFWNNSRKAFLNSTIKKRVLLRVEANPNEPIRIKYEDIENFSYKEIYGQLSEVLFFEEDLNNPMVENDEDKIYHIHKYYYENNTSIYVKYSYKANDLEVPMVEPKPIDTGFNKIPCWLIRNGGELDDEFGESDIQELMEAQTQYNRRISDFADSLKFQMFGVDSIIDAHPDDVESLVVAPNAINAMRTNPQAMDKGKQAVHNRLEYSFSGTDAINSYLDRAEADMRFALDIPHLGDLNNIPSAKAIKYLYNDLIARCEEKWNDWEDVFLDMINFILKAMDKVTYPSFDKSWLNMDYSLLLNHNYPIPSDEEDKKTLAINEVTSNVRSIRNYIKEFSDEEDSEKAFKEILEEIDMLSGANGNQLQLDNAQSDNQDNQGQDTLN